MVGYNVVTYIFIHSVVFNFASLVFNKIVRLIPKTAGELCPNNTTFLFVAFVLTLSVDCFVHLFTDS